MRHDADRAISVGLAWMIFVLLCILPIVWMLAQGASRELIAQIRGMAGERQGLLLGQTMLVGIGAAGAACLAGVPFGVTLARTPAKRVRLTRLALTLPLVFPSYVIALAWVSLTERRLGDWTYGLPGTIATLGFAFYPAVMLATEAALRRMAAHLEEAGRLVASDWRVWLHIVFPVIRPVVAASALVVFVLAISDFAVPSILRTRVYTTEVFTAFSALYDFRLATVTALPLGLVGAAASVAAIALSRPSLVARADHGPSGAPWPPGSGRLAVALLTAAAVVTAAGPVTILGVTAGRGRSLFADAASTEAILNSVVWSASAATFMLPIAILLGHWRTRRATKSAYLAEAVWIALFALPATVAGIGIVGLWNRSGITGDIYRTDAIVVIAYVARFLPIAALLCAAVLTRVPAGLHEAAILSGASWLRSMTGVSVPLARRSLAAVWLVVFILMLGDVSLTILVAPPGESNLAIRAYTLIANSPAGDVARVALVQVALSVIPLVFIVLLARDPKVT